MTTTAGSPPWGLEGDPYAEDPSLEAVALPLWREAFAPLEWWRLRASPVYYGLGVPRGHGEPVVVVPGFFENDAWLMELYWWLFRIGYQPYYSNIGRAIDCPDAMADALLHTVREAGAAERQAVRIVGHSLGGMLARTVAYEHPEGVDRVICLASPFRSVARVHPVIISAVRTLRGYHAEDFVPNLRPSCYSGHCTCRFVRNTWAPPDHPLRSYAIYSKTDGVAAWESCMEDDPSANDEVQSTHLGMLFNPDVYRAIARRLAED